MKSALSRPSHFLLLFCVIGAYAAIPFSHAGAADATTPVITSGSKPIRVYNCDQQVQSSKRGLCANKLSPEDFKALAPGVSWYYNWYYTTDDVPPVGVHFDFVPMCFGREGNLKGLADYLSTHPKPRAVLAINEPNIEGQAFFTPEATASYYKQIKALADKAGAPVIGPNMAMGSGASYSITAMDPIDKKTTTYLFMVPFLRAFNFYMGDVDVTATVFHSFGNFGEIKWAVQMMHDSFNKPVWVTEYGQWETDEPHQILDYMIQATDFMESSPDVGAYAWFKERVESNPTMSLLSGSGKLTRLGELYVAMPVHDADVYYRIPGKLKAEKYTTANSAEIERTTDSTGLFDMSTHRVGLLDYHIQVDKAGKYKLNFRISDAAGPVDILQGDQVLATVTAKSNTWQNVSAIVKLAAGPQTLRIRTSGQSINWIDFSKS